MVDHNDTQPSSGEQNPASGHRGGRRGTFVIALLAVALVAGLAGSMLSTAFGQSYSWQRIQWRHGGMFGGPLTPAQIDEHIDRATKHLAIELDATEEQRTKIANIAKAAIADLRPLREKAMDARSQAIALLTAPTIDRTAIESFRAQHVGLVETASKRIAQALADAAEVLTPEQRRKVSEWMTAGPPWFRWHHG